MGNGWQEEPDLTKGTSEWEGWGTALKPAWEPIVVARKPLGEKSVAENVLRWNVGGINIDKCRVFADNELNNKLSKNYEDARVSTKKRDGESCLSKMPSLQKGDTGMEKLHKEAKESTDLRKGMPSKVHDDGKELSLEGGQDETTRRLHSQQYNWATGTSGSDGKALGQESCRERGCTPHKRDTGRQPDREPDAGKQGEAHHEPPHNKGQENGPTQIGRWPSNLIHDGSPEVLSLFPNDSARFFYAAKASKRDRNDGCEGLEEKVRVRQGLAGEHKDTVSSNSHPTVKPTDLMRYLCRLVTPKGGTVLDPFMGSGSTGKAAKLEGFDFIGIEREPEYVKIAEARINAVKPESKLF